MSPEYKTARSIVRNYTSSALSKSGNDTEQALDVLRQWGEKDASLAGARALVGCQTAVNDQCLEIMEP